MEASVCSPYRNVTDISNVTIHKGDNECEQTEKSVTLAIYITLIFLIIPGNISVIISMWKTKQFSSNFSVYATSLAVTDLVVGVLALPIELVETLRPGWFLNTPMCIFLKLVAFVPTSVSIFLLDAIAYDRYICVTSPLLYRSRVTKIRSVIISITMGILGLLIWIPFFVGQQFDDVYSLTALGSCVSIFGYFTLGQAVLAYYLPAVYLVVVYILIQRALMKRTISSESVQAIRGDVYTIKNELNEDINMDSFIKAEVKSERDNLGTYEGTTATVITGDKPVTTGIFSENRQPGRLLEEIRQTTLSVRYLPNPPGVNPRGKVSRKYPHISVQNRTCFKTFSVVVFAFTLCWVPFFILWPMTKPCESRVFDLLFMIFSNLAYANSAFNPFIYVLTSKSMRSVIMNRFKRRSLVFR